MEYGPDEQFVLECQVSGAEKLFSHCKGLTIWLDLPKYEDPCSEVLLYSKVVIFAKLIALDNLVAKAILRIPHHTFFSWAQSDPLPTICQGTG